MQIKLFDLVNDPYILYNKMCEAGPIFWSEQYFTWFVLDYEITRSLVKDMRISSDICPYLKASTFPTKSRERVQPLVDLFSSWIVFADPPYHTVLRKILNPYFSATVLEALKPTIEKKANALLDQCDSTWDVIETIAKPLPAFVIAELMQLPQEDTSKFLAWNESWPA